MPNIIYRFVADGVAEVVKGFGDVESAAARARRGVRGQAQADVGASKASAAAARTRGSAARGAASDTDKAAAAELRAAERLAREKAKTEERARKHVARIRDRYFAEEQRAEERAARKAASVREREQRAMARRQERVAQERAARSARGGDAMKEGMKDLALGAGGAAIAAGTAVAGAAARQALTNQERAASLARSARGAGETQVDATVLRREAEAIAAAQPGVKAGDVLEASQAFVSKTGDLDSARRMASTFATMASASGAGMSDIAGTAAELRTKFQIADDADMKQALATLYMQGKSGSFELKDAASQYSKLGAAAAGFGLDKGVKGIQTLGGLTQIARSATGGPEQAASALEAMFRQVVAQSQRIEASGAKVYNADGSKRAIEDILVDTIAMVGGTDQQAKDIGLQKIFGEEGIRALRPLIATFNEATREGGDGVKALRDQLNKAINVPGAWADVQQDAANSQSQTTAQLTGAWEKVTAQVGDAVLPKLGELASKLADNQGAIDAFAGTIGVAVEALGALIDFLGSIPGVGDLFKPDRSPEAQRAKASKELERVQGMIEGRGGAAKLKPDDPLLVKQKALTEQIASIDETLSGGPSIQGGPLAQAEFDRQMAAADQTLQQRMSTFSPAELLMSPALTAPKLLSTAFGDTEQQAQLRARQEAAQGAVDAGGGAQVILRAGNDLLNAAAALRTAAEAQKAGAKLSVQGLS